MAPRNATAELSSAADVRSTWFNTVRGGWGKPACVPWSLPRSRARFLRATRFPHAIPTCPTAPLRWGDGAFINVSTVPTTAALSLLRSVDAGGGPSEVPV